MLFLGNISDDITSFVLVALFFLACLLGVLLPASLFYFLSPNRKKPGPIGLFSAVVVVTIAYGLAAIFGAPGGKDLEILGLPVFMGLMSLWLSFGALSLACFLAAITSRQNGFSLLAGMVICLLVCFFGGVYVYPILAHWLKGL